MKRFKGMGLPEDIICLIFKKSAILFIRIIGIYGRLIEKR
jgi:hypothetical protein